MGTKRLTAFAGKARSMTALKPLYSEATPSSLISSLRTSRKPLGYFPSGAEKQVQQQKLRHTSGWKEKVTTVECKAVLPGQILTGHTHTTFLNSQGGLVMSARYYKMSSTQTCLETRFKHVRWDGDGPVEDPSHPSGKQNAGNAELVVAAWVKQIIASEDVLKPSRQTGKTKHKPFPLWSEKVFEPLVGHEVHPAGWNVWNKTRKNYPQ